MTFSRPPRPPPAPPRPSSSPSSRRGSHSAPHSPPLLPPKQHRINHIHPPPGLTPGTILSPTPAAGNTMSRQIPPPTTNRPHVSNLPVPLSTNPNLHSPNIAPPLPVTRPYPNTMTQNSTLTTTEFSSTQSTTITPSPQIANAQRQSPHLPIPCLAQRPLPIPPPTTTPSPPATPTQKSSFIPSLRDSSAESADNACNECSVCFEKAVDTVIYTCGHMCLCYECAVDIRDNQGGLCPMCRQPIKDLIKTFRS